MTVRERIMLLLVVVLIGVLAGLTIFLATTNYFVKNNNSTYTEKVTEKQVYLENSETIQAVKTVSDSLVTVMDESKKADFLGLSDTFKMACFSIYSTMGADCGLNGVILTSDGIVSTISQDKDLESKKLLAFDNNGREFAVKFLSRDDSNDLVFLQLYRPGDEALPVEQRMQNYSFTPVNFADLKIVSVGQQLLILRGNIFNGLANLKQTVIAGLLRIDQIINWPVAFSSDEKLTVIGLADATGVAGNAITDLNGGLIGVSGAQGELIDIESIDNDLLKYKQSKLTRLPQLEFGLKVIRNSKQVAQNSNLSVDYGYIVSAVKADSLGQKLGLKEKDLIVEIDGTSLLYENLWDLLGIKIPGDEITMRVIRGKETLDLKEKL